MRDGFEAGLALIDAILERGELSEYHLAHAARADMCRRLGRTDGGQIGLRAGSCPGPAGAGAALSQRAGSKSLADFFLPMSISADAVRLLDELPHGIARKP